MGMIVQSGADLSAAELYEIWRLRDIVFAVEQQCDEADVDDVDLRPDCHHWWLTGNDGQIDSYLRTFEAEDGRHIGGVATRVEARGRGLSSRLLTAVIERWGTDENLILGAQSYLESWYAGFGFVTTGPHYTEAGIDHVPMRRERQR